MAVATATYYFRNRRVIQHPAAEFRLNRNIRRWNMTSYWFSRWRPSAMLYLLWGNGGPPTKCFSCSELCAQNACLSFWGVFGIYFPHMTSRIVVTPKRTVLGQKHVVELVGVRISATVWPGRRIEKKGQDNKKVTKVLYFLYLGETWEKLHGART